MSLERISQLARSQGKPYRTEKNVTLRPGAKCRKKPTDRHYD
jgi:hypothetical protein